MLDEVLVVFAYVLPFLLAGEHEARAKVAVHRHVHFLAHDDRVLDTPFHAALERLLLERAVFFGHEAVRVGIDAEDALAYGHVAAAHVVGVGNHALVLDVGAAELHVDKVARLEFLQREVCRLALVSAADFCGVGDVGPVQADFLLQVPVAVVDFERVDVDAVKTGQEVEGELAVDGRAAQVEDFHEHLVGADPVGTLLGLERFFVVMHDGGEVALGPGLLRCGREQALDACRALLSTRALRGSLVCMCAP